MPETRISQEQLGSVMEWISDNGGKEVLNRGGIVGLNTGVQLAWEVNQGRVELKFDQDPRLPVYVVTDYESGFVPLIRTLICDKGPAEGLERAGVVIFSKQLQKGARIP